VPRNGTSRALSTPASTRRIATPWPMMGFESPHWPPRTTAQLPTLIVESRGSTTGNVGVMRWSFLILCTFGLY
jgi:hypothetical protein